MRNPPRALLTLVFPPPPSPRPSPPPPPAAPAAPRRRGPRRPPAGIRAQAHRPALLGDTLLLRQEVDHGVRRGRVHLGGVRSIQAADVARELHDRPLHPIPEPQERDLRLPGEADGLHIPPHA